MLESSHAFPRFTLHAAESCCAGKPLIWSRKIRFHCRLNLTTTTFRENFSSVSQPELPARVPQMSDSDATSLLPSASPPQISRAAGQVVCYSHLFKNFLQCSLFLALSNIPLLGHLDCFQVLAVMNETAINIHVFCR